MKLNDSIAKAWKESYQKINEDIFNFTTIKPEVAAWIESTIILPDSTSVYAGPLSMDWTPYMREIVSHLHPSSPTRTVSLMKGSQSGATANLVIPGICYIISEIPDPILFTAGDLMLAQKTIEERLDPILRSSRLDHLIRPNVIKKGNNRTGDTSKSKEYAGGTLTALGTNSANSFRMFSARYIFADDYDTAPRDLGKEGSVKSLIQGRQNSYGEKAKTFFISTPTITATSNINDEYLLGTQKKWHWPCPHCAAYMPMDWQIKCDDGTFAGIVWKLDDNQKLIKDSVHFRCHHCGGLTKESQKYDLNLLGKWISSVESPEEDRHESYSMNGIITPPGFTGWVKLVQEWLQANPPGRKSVVRLLKAFNNQRLGLPFEELGEAPRVTELMQNTRTYHPGIVPDLTCEADGNGQIIMISLAADINGLMNMETEDVRLDWEIVAHSQTGVTYSIDHGSIGTFKRTRDRSKTEKENDSNREKWTLTPNVKNSVWKPLEEIMRGILIGESGKEHSIAITVIDTGFGEKLAMQFIKSFNDLFVFGIKGKVDENFRKLQRDSNPVKRSTENPQKLYIIEVNQMKDDLAQMMKLRPGEDGSQPSGYMNYPQPNDGKYTMKSYFSHYEGERRVEVKKDDQVIGFRWDKKNNQVQNHFWDVRVYNLAAPLIYLDIVKQSDPKFRMITWEDFVLMVVS